MNRTDSLYDPSIIVNKNRAAGTKEKIENLLSQYNVKYKIEERKRENNRVQFILYIDFFTDGEIDKFLPELEKLYPHV